MTAMGFRIDRTESGGQRPHIVPPVDFQHVLIEGQTGSGKTASIILPTLKDRIERGHGVIFFDYKGHEHAKIKMLADKAGRLNDVVEVGKPHGVYINLLNELDIKRLKALISDHGASRDPYWPNSAANLAEDIVVPLRGMHDIVHALSVYGDLSTKLKNILEPLESYGIDLNKPLSFKMFSKIIANPQQLRSLKEILSVFPSKLEALAREDATQTKPVIQNGKNILAKILRLDESVKALDRFTLETKSDTNSGNNAVLQVLDNTLSSYARRDYINTDEYTLKDLIGRNAIVILDVRSFGNDIMKLLLETILDKALRRISTGTQSPMSVFVDEANRVLFPSIDLHSDVMREAQVELIIAIQNAEQMMTKFGQTLWDSIRGNIRHQYFIDVKHQVTYNDDANLEPEPLEISKGEMKKSEQAFYALSQNRINIEKYFLGDIDALPDVFTVNYDLDLFEQQSAIMIENIIGEKFLFTYHGEEVIREVRKVYPAPKKKLSLMKLLTPVEDESDIPYAYDGYSYFDEWLDEEDDWDKIPF